MTIPATSAEIAAGVTIVDGDCVPYNVRRYGTNTVPGSTDMTTAFRAAVKAQQQAAQVSSSNLSVGSIAAPYIFVPSDIYRITGNITNGASVNQLNMRGEMSILELDPGVTGVATIGYQARIENMSFRGGDRHIRIDTNQVDTTQIYITGCEFHSPATTALDSTLDSNSSRIVVFQCKFWSQLPTSRVCELLTCDYANFAKCSVRMQPANNAVFSVDNGELRIEDLEGIDGPGLKYWARVGGAAHFLARDCRFGGEAGGAQTAVVRSETAFSVFMEHCICPSPGPLIQFAARFPASVVVRDCSGLTPSAPFDIDISSPPTSADFLRLGSGGTRFLVENNGTEINNEYSALFNMMGGNPSRNAAGRSVSQLAENPHRSGYPASSDVLINSAGHTAAFAQSDISSNVSVSTTTVNPGYPSLSVVASADNGAFTRDYTTALAGLPTGSYTAVFDISVDVDLPVRVLLGIGGRERGAQVFSQGRYTVCLPFYFDGANSDQSLSFRLAALPQSAAASLLKFRVLRGRWDISGARTIMEGTAAPGSGNWLAGDIVMDNATAGDQSFFMCTTAGSPGTWSRGGFLVLQGSAPYDPASLADGAGVTTTVTVTGAALGDFASATFGVDLQGITLTAWVSSGNTVSVRFQNESGGILDLASSTLLARVTKA